MLDLRHESGVNSREERSRSCSSQSFENISITDIVASGEERSHSNFRSLNISPESLALQTPLSSVSSNFKTTTSTRDASTSSSATSHDAYEDHYFSESADSPVKANSASQKYSQIEELFSEGVSHIHFLLTCTKFWGWSCFLCC